MKSLFAKKHSPESSPQPTEQAHNIFYTAITRSRDKLKIYWTPEVEQKVLTRIKPKDISKDVEILKEYLK